MNSSLSFTFVFTTIFMLAALAGCAAGPNARHKQHHPAATYSQRSGAPNEQGKMDMTAMCKMHREMMAARTQDERKAMMESRMKGMTPDMMHKHMTMMQEKCE